MDDKDTKESANELLQNFTPFLRNHKSLIINMGILLVLVFLISGLTTNLGVSLKQKTDTEQQISNMHAEINTYNQQMDTLKKFPKRIPDQKEVDKLQSNIIFNMQACNLEILTMRENAKDSGDHGKMYVTNFQGSYEDVMTFLDDLYQNDNLIGIKDLKIDINNGKTNVNMTYKIYYKG